MVYFVGLIFVAVVVVVCVGVEEPSFLDVAEVGSVSRVPWLVLVAI